ncbi:MAG: hypothetical protein GY822_02765 [Deltaproteobacteria bacterium]|nr:hypothetical protein [Deltaproteobacteria bacterium]
MNPILVKSQSGRSTEIRSTALCSSALLAALLFSTSGFAAPALDVEVAEDRIAPGYIHPQYDVFVPRNTDIFIQTYSGGEGFFEVALCDAGLEICELEAADFIAYPCAPNGICVLRYDPGILEGNTAYQLSIQSNGGTIAVPFSTAAFDDDEAPMKPVVQEASVQSSDWELDRNYLIVDVDSSTISTDGKLVLFYEEDDGASLLQHVHVLWNNGGEQFISGIFEASDNAVERCFSISIVDVAGNEGPKSEAQCLTFPSRRIDPFAGCSDNAPLRSDTAPLSALGLIGFGWARLRSRRRRRNEK